MLARLSASNFLSIDAPIEFSMVASKESQHLDRVAEGDNMPARVLQTAAIWGGNASGKSNLCKILKYSQYMVVTGTRPDGPTGRIPFRLREQATKEPSRFEFEILVEGEDEERMFRYIFAVNAREVVEESLAEMRPVSDRLFFSRTSGAESSTRFSGRLSNT
jgi:AAA15 family ATPase/GTPase